MHITMVWKYSSASKWFSKTLLLNIKMRIGFITDDIWVNRRVYSGNSKQ